VAGLILSERLNPRSAITLVCTRQVTIDQPSVICQNDGWLSDFSVTAKKNPSDVKYSVNVTSGLGRQLTRIWRRAADRGIQTEKTHYLWSQWANTDISMWKLI